MGDKPRFGEDAQFTVGRTPDLDPRADGKQYKTTVWAVQMPSGEYRVMDQTGNTWRESRETFEGTYTLVTGGGGG